MHLFKRRNIYYYKLCIPKEFQKLIPLSIIKFSLHTKLKKEAVHLSSSLTSKYYSLFLKFHCGIYTEIELTPMINEGLYLNINQLNLNTHRAQIHTLEELSSKYAEDKMITNIWIDKTSKAYTSKTIDVI